MTNDPNDAARPEAPPEALPEAAPDAPPAPAPDAPPAPAPDAPPADGPAVVVDHLTGSRRGQRQQFGPIERVRFGRHPDNEVSFDANRDLDASSRHAELRRHGARYVLVDVGSSNGTLIGGLPITDVPVEPGNAVLVEFGRGGPRLRIYLGDPAQIPPLPDVTAEHEPLPASAWMIVVLLVLGILVVAIAAWISLV